jgi:hypothetical protein
MKEDKMTKRSVTQYAPELRFRLMKGDSIHTTTAWFIKKMAREKLQEDADFTPKERRFWNSIIRGHVQFMTRYVLQP